MSYRVSYKQSSSSGQKKAREQSQFKPKLRNSVQSMKHLTIELNRLRTSLSTSCLNYFDRLSFGQNYNQSPLPNVKKKLKKSSPTQLRMKFEHLQQKLEKAKDYMRSMEKNSVQSKLMPKVQLKQQVATSCNESKECILETDNKKDKQELRNNNSIKNLHKGLKVPSTGFSVRGQKYYISELIRAMEEKSSQAMQHINQSIQGLLQYKLIKMNFQGKQQKEKIILAKSSAHKKTLFIDLDQTLVHCNQNKPNQADIQVSINLNGTQYKLGFNLRPYAITFLKSIKKKWELIMFTASHQIYADTILDQIDPDRQLFDHRMYREHCKELTTEYFIKDISRFNRDLSQSVMVDNSAYSFAMQIDNGIPILPYYEGKDHELAALETYLSKLVEQEDVRVMNRKYFQMFRYTSFDNSYDLVRQLYCP